MSNFNATSLNFFEKFDHLLLDVFLFGNMFSDSPVHVQIDNYLISEWRRNCSIL